MPGRFGVSVAIDRPIEAAFATGNGLVGKVLEPLALRAARKGADEFGAIKRAVEASTGSRAG